MSTSVALHIEQLVLQGFGERDGARVLQAFRAELTRLFEQSGAPGRAGRVGQLDAGVIRFQPGRDEVAPQVAVALLATFTAHHARCHHRLRPVQPAG